MADLKRLPKRNGPRFCQCVHDQYKSLKLGLTFHCGDPIKDDMKCAIERCNLIVDKAIGPVYCGRLTLGGRKFKPRLVVPKGVGTN